MTTNRKRRAGSVFLLKLRQNWRWGKTRPWRDLIEEHDLNPVVRGQRAWRRTWWHLAKRGRPASATPVFLVGVQRSGTNMLAHGLAEVPEFQVYNEGNTKAFHDYRLCPLETIDALIRQSRAEFVLFKPLCDSHRTPELLDRFGPSARAIWAYRNVDDRVRSAITKFGDSNLRVLRAYATGQAKDAWQVQRLSPENADFIRSFDFSRLTAESGAALFWYVRNSLYFEMALDRRSDTMLAPYDLFLVEPEQVARSLCAFLGLDYREELIAHVDPRRRGRKEPLAIDPRIRERCTALQDRLDSVGLPRISKPAAGNPAPASVASMVTGAMKTSGG